MADNTKENDGAGKDAITIKENQGKKKKVIDHGEWNNKMCKTMNPLSECGQEDADDDKYDKEVNKGKNDGGGCREDATYHHA